MNDHCLRIGIPAYLHQNDRNPDPTFEGEELVFRRFFVNPPKETWLGKANQWKSAKIFRLENDSYNREKYCLEPADVLFNINATHSNDHFFNWGILSLKIKEIQGFSFQVEINGIGRSVTFRLIHKPETCMFPHAEIHAFQDGNLVDEVAPKSLRAVVRDIFVETCEVVKEPELTVR